MRIGLVCPYSLTVPGGVQGQVLGLAAVAAAMGHEARVLAPCDGPPPDAGVTPLGQQHPAPPPTARSRPLAPDASRRSCARSGPLRDEDFDVLHLHEPLAPGPTMTALLCTRRPLVGTFHAAGRQRRRTAGSTRRVRLLADRLDCGARCPHDARRAGRALPRRRRTSVLFNGIEVERYRQGRARGPPTARRSCSSAATSPARASTCCSTALAALPPDVRLWVRGDGPETDRAAGTARAATRASSGSGGVSDEEKARRLRGADVFCAPSLRGESFGVVLLEAMAARTAIVASRPARLPQRGPARSSTPSLVPPGDRDGAGRRPAAGAGRPRSAGAALVSSGRRAGRASSRWTTWPSATSSSTTHALHRASAAAAAGRQPGITDLITRVARRLTP